MKKIFFVLVAVLSLTACGNGNKSTNNESSAKEETVAISKAVYVDDLLTNAASQVDKEVIVKGVITHTCKHSGRRCFIVGQDQKTSIRVEAKGNIGGFNRELIGSEIAVKGILRENRLTKEYIDQMEEQVNDKQGKEDGSAETCEAEMNNINGMREWMKANNKDFYSLYFIDGQEYEVIE